MEIKSKNKFELNFYQISLEIGIVAIGILIAFQLNSWKETRNRSLSERKILEEIKSNLTLDLIDLNTNANGHRNGIAIIDSLRNAEKYKLTEMDIGLFFFKGMRDYTFTPQTGAFETLKSKGVDLITNDSLRLSILRLYDFELQSLVYIETSYQAQQFYSDFKYISNKYYERLYFSFPIGSPEFWKSSIVKQKHEGYSWLQNPDVQLRLDRVEMEQNFVFSYYKQTKKLVLKTIEDINTEMSR